MKIYFKKIRSFLLWIIFLSVATIGYSQSVITLICKTSTGESMGAPLVIDYAKNIARWGGPDLYEIKYKTDEWITLFQTDAYNKIGGEIAVLNRLTGEYKRVAISDFCTDRTCTSKRVSNSYYYGTCFQQKY